MGLPRENQLGFKVSGIRANMKKTLGKQQQMNPTTQFLNVKADRL
jgi:hypothetical protein